MNVSPLHTPNKLYPVPKVNYEIKKEEERKEEKKKFRK